MSCGLPNVPSLSANEVDVVVVVLKLSGESVLLSGMDMEVFRGVKTVENVLLFRSLFIMFTRTFSAFIGG